MELLEGGSLRALLDRGHLLSPAQAASRRRRRGPGPRLRPPAGPGPSRHQAGQPDLRRRGAPDGGRLRSGPGPGRGHLDRTRRRGGRHGPVRRARSRSEASRSTAAPTSTPWRWCWSRPRPARSRSPPTPPSATLMARLDRPVRRPAGPGRSARSWRRPGRSTPRDRLDALGLARALDGVGRPAAAAGAAAAGGPLRTAKRGRPQPDRLPGPAPSVRRRRCDEPDGRGAPGPVRSRRRRAQRAPRRRVRRCPTGRNRWRRSARGHRAVRVVRRPGPHADPPQGAQRHR